MARLLVLQHLERESPGFFLEIAQEMGLNLKIVRLDLGDLIPELISGDLILILGGPMGIIDLHSLDYPWLLNEFYFIKEALNKNFPIIGVCLGAQLLAYAAGGNVEPLVNPINNQLSPEIGWGPIFLSGITHNNQFNSYFRAPFSVLHWHGDRILLPKHAELIASSQRCKEQFFKIGSNAYGLQFHVEVDDTMFYRWIEEDYDFIQLALGKDAKIILKDQQKIESRRSLQRRLSFIRVLLELIVT